MRLFIAINFDEQTKQHILEVQRQLHRIGRGRFSRPENLHLTLAFLGEVEANRVKPVCQAMDSLSFTPMTLEFAHTGCFKRDGGNVWWIGLADSKALTTLQRMLCDRLQENGMVLESRPFIPHITLARQVNFSCPVTQDLLTTPFTTKVDTISLMLSQRESGRLNYIEQYAVKSKE